MRGAARRLGHVVVTVFGATLLVWGLLPLTPGDPARRYLNQERVIAPTEAQLTEARAELGLDRPLHEQYLAWLGGVLRGDLGASTRWDRPVTEVIATHLPATVRLAVATVALALVAAVVLALVGAAFAGRWPDKVTGALALGGVAVPAFLVGLVLIEVVVVEWGFGRVITDGSWSAVWLPAATLAWLPAAMWSRLLRSGLLSALRSGYALTAASRGASRARVLVVHGLPNAAVPVLTAVALTFGWMLGGAVIVEGVFAWPGIGLVVVQAITARDLAVVQGFALVATVMWVGVSLVTGALAALVDARLRERTSW